MSNQYTQLVDRKLWYDGQSSIDPINLLAFIQQNTVDKSTKIYVDQITNDVVEFNRFAETKIELKETLTPLSYEWQLPNQYKTMLIDRYVVDKLQQEIKTMSSFDREKRVTRTVDELAIFHNCGYDNLLRTMIYVVDTFIEKEIVWGVGRGSSISSYVLYLIGVHDIDSVEYDLNFHEFIKNDT